MDISIFDLCSIGIGPSSSHTVGPMKAAKTFAEQITHEYPVEQIHKITVELFGSLALTATGHGTDLAVLNGLLGFEPETVDPNSLLKNQDAISQKKQINFNQKIIITFDIKTDLIHHFDKNLPKHPNALTFNLLDKNNNNLVSKTYYSVGGGFIVEDSEFGVEKSSDTKIPYPFDTAKQLVNLSLEHNLNIGQIMLANEKCWRSEEKIKQDLLKIADIMAECIQIGCTTPGILPGGLKVKRRAAELYKKLQIKGVPSILEDADIMNRLNMYAMAVNEQNAAGQRVVTAPTNGAAGIIPAVLEYYKNFHTGANQDGIIRFLLTAGAIAILYKKGASISGAEVGCQGEVGVASSMAAGALTAVLGGTIHQVENAAEIAMEHHLGMTCDPVGGLVQIPCIERNAMGAIKAVNAARLALMEEGEHKIPLDKVIATMKATGRDMMSIYKETSQGGLAVNHPEC